jgi:hypothetical protein
MTEFLVESSPGRVLIRCGHPPTASLFANPASIAGVLPNLRLGSVNELRKPAVTLNIDGRVGVPDLSYDRANRALTLRYAASPTFADDYADNLLRACMIALMNLSVFDSGCYLVHAGAMQSRDRTMLLIGGSGAGKTTIALRANQSYEAALLGDNMSWIRVDQEPPKVTLLASTPRPSLRLNVAKVLFPAVVDRFADEPYPDWDRYADIADMVSFSSGPHEVTDIVFLGPTFIELGEATIEEASPFHAATGAYSAISEFVDGRLYQYSLGQAIPSMDETAARCRREADAGILGRCRCWLARGSCDGIAYKLTRHDAAI